MDRVRTLMAFNRWFCHHWHDLHVTNAPSWPNGPSLVVANHVSGLDPLAIQSVCPRLIRWMMAREYYESQIFGPVYRAMQCIPVDRTRTDASSLRTALRALHAGEVVGIFPEGGFPAPSPWTILQTMAVGASQIAARTQLPVVVVGVISTGRGETMVAGTLLPRSVRLNFSEPQVFQTDKMGERPAEKLEKILRRKVEELRISSLSV